MQTPMLAVTLPDGIDPPFATVSMGATPKVDGIRALIINGRLVSRTMKPIPNLAIRAALEAVLPEGADGEIMSSAFAPTSAIASTMDIPQAPPITFQECTSMVMSVHKVPPPGTTTFFMFDMVPGDTSQMDVPYVDRMAAMAKLRISRPRVVQAIDVRVVYLLPTLITDREHLDAYEATCLQAGYEGVMLRRMDGRYKAGRSTLREGLLLKIKRFTDAEASIVGCEQLVHSGDSGMQVSGLLGAFVVRIVGTVGTHTFKIGTGFTMADRAAFWKRRVELVNTRQLVKFKYMAVGVKDAPRFPVFIGMRHQDDV